MSEDKKNKRSQSAGAGQQARTPSTGERGGPKPSGAHSPGQSDRDVGHALRSVYSTTVNEEIPSELLDLLGKLS